MKKIFLILFIGLASCSQETNEILYKVESSASTNIQIENLSDQDSVKVYLTIQSPNSVIGMFGITDTTGSKSQGYFFAKKNSSYFLNSSKSLYGFNISFEAPPMSCSQAISNGFLKGINIIEGSINCDYETFDISCVDGVNCIIKTSVTDSINWTTGFSSENLPFVSTKNKMFIDSNCNIRGVFPYRCTDCIQINPKNIPENCFGLNVNCSENRTCQVNRAKNNGGTINIHYLKSLK